MANSVDNFNGDYFEGDRFHGDIHNGIVGGRKNANTMNNGDCCSYNRDKRKSANDATMTTRVWGESCHPLVELHTHLMNTHFFFR